MLRRFQFSLKTLLVALTAACLWLGLKVERARKQRKAVEAIEAIGALPQYDWQGEVGNWKRSGAFRFVPSDAKRLCPVALRRAMGEHLFQNVTSVVFGPSWNGHCGGGAITTYPRHSRYVDAEDPDIEIERDIEDLIPHLRNLPYLRTIYLHGGHPGLSPLTVSYEAEDELRDALPRCRIVRERVCTVAP